MTIADVNNWIIRAWHDYTGLLAVAGGVLGLLTLVGLLIYARTSHRPIRPTVIWIGSNLGRRWPLASLRGAGAG